MSDEISSEDVLRRKDAPSSSCLLPFRAGTGASHLHILRASTGVAHLHTRLAFSPFIRAIRVIRLIRDPPFPIKDHLVSGKHRCGKLRKLRMIAEGVY